MVFVGGEPIKRGGGRSGKKTRASITDYSSSEESMESQLTMIDALFHKSTNHDH